MFQSLSPADPKTVGFLPKNGRIKRIIATIIRKHEIGLVKNIIKLPPDIRRDWINELSTSSLITKPIINGAPS